MGGAGMPSPCPATECTEDGQGGPGTQESPGRTEQNEPLGPMRPTPAEKGGVGRPPPCQATKCTSDGQVGLGPQVSPGRTGQQGHQGPTRPGPAKSLTEGIKEGR